MAQNRTMQQKNLINRKRAMKEVISRQYDIMSHEYRDYLDYDMGEAEPSWVHRRATNMPPLTAHQAYEKALNKAKVTRYERPTYNQFAGRLVLG